MPSLVPDYVTFRKETTRLTDIITSTVSLTPSHRKFIAEIALLRLAILIENSMRSVFCKLTCGATYIDGSHPLILSQKRNIPAAIAAMQNLNRPKFRYSLPWNDGAEIRENIEFLIDPADLSHQELKNYASFLTEIRYIRNHIAHRNHNSRVNFVKLIRKYYGARVPGVTCGNLLVSPRVSPRRPLIETHLITANIMMKDIVRA
jgi:hypothetical protein